MPSELVRSEKQGDVVVVTIDSPPVNSLSQGVVQGLISQVKQANKDNSVRAIVIRGAGENFVAGADIGELQQAVAALSKGVAPGEGGLAANLTGALEEFERNAKPIVMAIDGFALGGGLELAMSGHWRVGTNRARVGLPELQLGLIPGAGGTQRLPRLAGLQKAAEMMLTSSPIQAAEALELGVLNEIVEPSELLEQALAAARELADGKRTPVHASKQNDKLPDAATAQQMVDMAKAMMADKARNLIHPELCLDAILKGVVDGYDAGLKREAENFLKCLASSQAGGLIHMFFSTRSAPKVPGVTDQKLPQRQFARAAVLGGGTMGSGIATSLLYAGLQVVLKEVNDEFAAAGRGRIERNLASRLKKGKLSQAKYDDMLNRLSVQTDYNGFDTLDIVIEGVVENIELKQQVFADLKPPSVQTAFWPRTLQRLTWNRSEPARRRRSHAGDALLFAGPCDAAGRGAVQPTHVGRDLEFGNWPRQTVKENPCDGGQLRGFFS